MATGLTMEKENSTLFAWEEVYMRMPLSRQ